MNTCSCCNNDCHEDAIRLRVELDAANRRGMAAVAELRGKILKLAESFASTSANDQTGRWNIYAKVAYDLLRVLEK